MVVKECEYIKIHIKLTRQRVEIGWSEEEGNYYKIHFLYASLYYREKKNIILRLDE